MKIKGFTEGGSREVDHASNGGLQYCKRGSCTSFLCQCLLHPTDESVSVVNASWQREPTEVIKSKKL